MKIKKFNESISTFTYETFDFFDLIVEKLKKNKGYTIFSIEKEEDFCKVFNFETKEEFVNKAIRIHGSLYNYDNIDYINNQTKINIKCNKHEVFRAVHILPSVMGVVTNLF